MDNENWLNVLYASFSIFQISNSVLYTLITVMSCKHYSVTLTIVSLKSRFYMYIKDMLRFGKVISSREIYEN